MGINPPVILNRESKVSTIPLWSKKSRVCQCLFIACALVGDAEYVVTVDKDLLSLETLGDVRMVTPHKFVAILG